MSASCHVKSSHLGPNGSISLIKAVSCRGLATEFKDENEKEPISKMQALKPKLMNVSIFGVMNGYTTSLLFYLLIITY